MIELAPGHKQGLPATNPIWIAGGIVGYGEALPRGLEMGALGGVVVGPVMASSRPGSTLPRVAHTPGGLVLETGWQNRGASNVMARYAKLWPKLGCPVVVQLVDTDPRSISKLAERVATAAGVSGLEVVPLTTEVEVAARMVRNIVRASDLPLWVKVPLEYAVQWAEALVMAGANGLVVGQPPRGALATPSATVVSGGIYGPLAFAMTFPVLHAVAGLHLPAALIAAGGIHTSAQIEQALASGASAVQIDTAVWVEPALPNWLAGEWAMREAEKLEKR